MTITHVVFHRSTYFQAGGLLLRVYAARAGVRRAVQAGPHRQLQTRPGRQVAREVPRPHAGNHTQPINQSSKQLMINQ